MTDITQKTQDAFLAGSNITMDESFNFFAAVCIAGVILVLAYIVLCVLKGVGDESVKMGDAPGIIIRGILIVLILSSFFYFQ